MRSGLSVQVPKYFLPRALNLTSILAGNTSPPWDCFGKARVVVVANARQEIMVHFMISAVERAWLNECGQK